MIALAPIVLLLYLPLLLLILRDAIDFDRPRSKAAAPAFADGVKLTIQERPEAVAQLAEEGHSTREAADIPGVHATVACDAAVSSGTNGVEEHPESPISNGAVVASETGLEDASLTSAYDDAAAAVVSATVGRQEDVLPAESGLRDEIASQIEMEIFKAVKVVPGCEKFQGVIVTFTRSNSHSNWDVQGVRFGRADRTIGSDAIAKVVTRLQGKFRLVEGS